MDIDRQRKLEWLRILPIFGGIALMVFGNVELFSIGVDGTTLVVVICTLAIGGGALLAAFGVAAIKYRKWVYSVEERLTRLEKDHDDSGR